MPRLSCTAAQQLTDALRDRLLERGFVLRHTLRSLLYTPILHIRKLLHQLQHNFSVTKADQGIGIGPRDKARTLRRAAHEYATTLVGFEYEDVLGLRKPAKASSVKDAERLR